MVRVCEIVVERGGCVGSGIWGECGVCGMRMSRCGKVGMGMLEGGVVGWGWL
jgi:hypothetical protein